MTLDTISALVNLGSAGAVIYVVILFLKFSEKQTKQSQEFFTALNANNKDDIAEMRTTADHLVKSLDGLLAMYSQHDTRAQNIAVAIEAIKADLAKLSKPARGSKTS
jgi:uncharacterized lipoprotein YehR (DUF1307 family)